MTNAMKPTHAVCFDKEGYAKEVGVAWENAKGTRIAVQLDSVPLNWDGKLKLFRLDKEAVG